MEIKLLTYKGKSYIIKTKTKGKRTAEE